jgi:hypothetical protein
MQWLKVERGELYIGGDYELLRCERGFPARRWGVFHRGRHVKTVHALADAKRWADDHQRAWHAAELEESGNAVIGGGV